MNIRCKDCDNLLINDKCVMCITKFIEPEKTYKVYKLIIKKTGEYYIGYTGQKNNNRYLSHKQRCFSEKDSYRNSLFYLKVRGNNITKETWDFEIKKEILYDNILILERVKAIESIVINEFKKDILNLNERN